LVCKEPNAKYVYGLIKADIVTRADGASVCLAVLQYLFAIIVFPSSSTETQMVKRYVVFIIHFNIIGARVDSIIQYEKDECNRSVLTLHLDNFIL